MKISMTELTLEKSQLFKFAADTGKGVKAMKGQTVFLSLLFICPEPSG